MTIHRIIADLDGHHKQGLRTEDADVAERWSQEAPRNAKTDGHIATPCVVHFEPRHDDNPPAAIRRLLARFGVQADFDGSDALVCDALTLPAKQTLARHGLTARPTKNGTLRIACTHARPHGDEIIRSVDRLHMDVVRKADGTPDVRALYHYPPRDKNDDSSQSAAHPLLSKRQWAKVPTIASRRHWIIPQES